MTEQRPVIVPAHLRGVAKQTAELMDGGATPEEVINVLAARLQLSSKTSSK